MKQVREGYMMTELGKVPAEWEVSRLGDLYLDMKTGATPSRKYPDYFKGEIPWLSSGELKKKYIRNTKEKITEKAVKDTNLIIYPVGTFFIAITGLEAAGTRGSCGINLVEVTTNQSCLSFTPTNKMSNEYLYYWYSLYGENLAFQYAQGTKQQSLNRNIIAEIEILKPPLQEQQKIAEILSTVDEQIENTEQQIEKTKELKRGLMQKILTKGTRHTEFKQTELGEIPVEWAVKRIADLIDEEVIISHIDGNHGSLYPKSNEFVENGVSYVSANSINRGRIDFSKVKYLPEHKAKLFKKGVARNEDVLFAHNATVGPVALLQTNEVYVILSTSLTLFRTYKKALLPTYLYYLLSSQSFVKQYEKVMSQTTRNQVPITTQRRFYLIIPPIKEQQKIAEILSSVDEQIESYEQEKAKYLELKRGLMQQLLTGRMRVTV